MFIITIGDLIKNKMKTGAKNKDDTNSEPIIFLSN
jgi:hypothetical protein